MSESFDFDAIMSAQEPYQAPAPVAVYQNRFIARPYQVECESRIHAELKTANSTLYVMATGAGKTSIFASLAKNNNTGRTLVIAHRRELVTQAARRIEEITGERADIEMGEDRADSSKHWRARTVVSSIQTQNASSRGAGRMHRFKPEEFSLVICDEAHHAPADSWKAVIAYYRQNPQCKVVGCTATPQRSDSKSLGQIFESVAFEFGLSEAIRDGWLVPIKQRQVYIESMDFSSVRTTAGDLNGADLAEIMEFEKNLHAVADPLYQLSAGRQTIVFASSVAHAERLAEILRRHKAGCARVVTNKTPLDTRAEMLRDFAAKKFQFLSNCGVCTEGFDCPVTEVVAMARPTKSQSLYCQMAGRATRALPGVVDGPPTAFERKQAIAASAKTCCEIIDFVGNTGKHSLVCCTDILGGKQPDAVIIRAKKLAKDAGMEQCDVAETISRAKKQLEDEESTREEARKRALVIGKAKFSSSTTAAFAVMGLKLPSNPGPSASDKQKQYLEKHGAYSPDMTAEAASAMEREIKHRFAARLCSFRQAKTLKTFGYNPNSTFQEASDIMTALRANGWKRPVVSAEVPF